VAALAQDHGVVAVHRDAPWRTLAALLTDLRRQPAAVAFAAGGTIGHIPGDIRHWWHGHLHNRRYADLPAIIHDYDPATDLSAPSPLPQWAPHAIAEKPEMVAAIADYFRHRDEDGAAD
jgi:hypothetical protein